MKTTKTIIGIILIALASSSFAQLSTLNDHFFPGKTDYISNMEVIHEDDPGVESWMTTPFANELTEADLSVEAWMTVPFKTDLEIEVLSLESWMTIPFETGQAADQDWIVADNASTKH